LSGTTSLTGPRAGPEELRQVAARVRRHIIGMIGLAGSGHPGGSLSAADLLTALYFRVLRLNPADPAWPERDRFVLSKGHAAPALYAVLAERGFFPVEELRGLRRLGSILQGHPDMKSTPGVEASTGSLGQGLSFGVGLAAAAKLDRAAWRVYVMLGDGELQEGQVWEAAMSAVHFRLDNLTAIVDCNGLQIDGPVEEVMSISPLVDKWRAFGWNVLSIDGHDMVQILDALETADRQSGRPTVILARTVKGRGVGFMENRAEWHGKAPSGEQLEEALRALGASGGPESPGTAGAAPGGRGPGRDGRSGTRKGKGGGRG